MKKISIALIITLLLAVLLTGCGRTVYNDSTSPVQTTPYPTVDPMPVPDVEDGMVNEKDTDGVIGNETPNADSRDNTVTGRDTMTDNNTVTGRGTMTDNNTVTGKDTMTDNNTVTGRGTVTGK